MWWTNSLCTSANEDLGTFAEYDPLTGYEPNDYHILETTEPYIQESTSENGSLNLHDFKYDDVTISIATVHPGARRWCEPLTSLSLLWRRIVVQSVVVACRS